MEGRGIFPQQKYHQHQMPTSHQARGNLLLVQIQWTTCFTSYGNCRRNRIITLEGLKLNSMTFNPMLIPASILSNPLLMLANESTTNAGMYFIHKQINLKIISIGAAFPTTHLRGNNLMTLLLAVADKAVAPLVLFLRICNNVINIFM